jgi:hypothetical protein
VQNVYDGSVGCKKCEPTTPPTSDSVIVESKMYMAEVLGAKCISRNKLDMKNEK